MAGYGQFCAVARALDSIGERWTLLIIRELMLGAATFTEIRRGLPRIPRATLAARLRALQSSGIVEATAREYRLSQVGSALAPVVRELAKWSIVSGQDLANDDLDTASLTWDMQRRINRPALPERTVVLAIDFVDRSPSDRHFWLHLSRDDVQLCSEDTGAPVDVWLASATNPATRWWLGQMSWAQLLRQPDVQLHGDATLIRQMQYWFLGYVFTPEALDLSTPE